MKRKILLILPAVVILVLTFAAPAHPEDVKTLLKEIFPIPSATGNEEILADKIASLLPRSAAVEKDNLGSLYAKTRGAGSSLVLFAALDEFGYFVSRVEPDGYLRVDRAFPTPLPIQDSFLMGHAVSITTHRGVVEGVVCQPSLHIATPETREKLSSGPGLDMIYIDIGVRSEAEARARGIDILDPVTFTPDLITLANDRLGGPSIGLKAACAALVSAFTASAGGAGTSGISCVWAAQTRMTARKFMAPLGAVRAKLKLKPKAIIVIGVADADRDGNGPMIGKGPVITGLKEPSSGLGKVLEEAAHASGAAWQRGIASDPLLESWSSDGTEAVILAIPVKFLGTPSEIVDMKDVRAVADIAARAAVLWGTR